MYRRFTDSAGQSLLETAALLPLIALLTLGLLNLGLVALVAGQAESAAQYGARMGAITPADPGAAAMEAAARQLAVSAIGSYTIQLLRAPGDPAHALVVRVGWRAPNYLNLVLAEWGLGTLPDWQGAAEVGIKPAYW